MKNKSVLFFIISILLQQFLFSQNQERWNPITEMGGNIFSSYILATAGSKNISSKKAQNYNGYQKNSQKENITVDAVVGLFNLLSGNREVNNISSNN